jgi:26S proteasome regulatory subunit N10
MSLRKEGEIEKCGLTGRDGIQLALKHRGNKAQRQRIILFTCSPVAEDGKMLAKLGKKMKKNNISVDVIALGEASEEDAAKLEQFNKAVNGYEGSYYGVFKPDTSLLSDRLLTTTLFDSAAEDAAGPSGSGGDTVVDGSQFEFGVNPSVDPELALALRMSFEEETARQDRERIAREEAEAKEKLQGIPEADEKDPLLGDQKDGAEAESSSSAKKDDKKDGTKDVKKDDTKDGKKDDDEDKMDIA